MPVSLLSHPVALQLSSPAQSYRLETPAFGSEFRSECVLSSPFDLLPQRAKTREARFWRGYFQYDCAARDFSVV